MADTDSRSLPDVLSAITGDLATLVRKESELVRSDVSEKIADAARAGTTMSVGAALLLGGFLSLMAALILGLSEIMHPAFAALAVGAVAALIGLSLVRGAAKAVRPGAMAPERSVRQLQKDAQLMKGQVR